MVKNNFIYSSLNYAQFIPVKIYETTLENIFEHRKTPYKWKILISFIVFLLLMIFSYTRIMLEYKYRRLIGAHDIAANASASLFLVAMTLASCLSTSSWVTFVEQIRGCSGFK